MLVIYKYAIIIVLGLAILVFVLLFFVSAPYGKFLRKGWGPVIRSKWAWMIMESPSPLLMIMFFMFSGSFKFPYLLFIFIWLSHYLHRTYIYPFTQPGKNKAYPVVIVLLAFVFNCLNGFINGYGIFFIYDYDPSWMISWQFITGIILFASGYYINKRSDEEFRRLRILYPGEYVVPESWLFRYISNPHYFGEIIEWGGWAVMTWSLPGFTFFVFTIANLFPRAISSHRWYKENFRDFPSERKAIIPFII